MTRETVIGATPARFAMSTMVGRRFFSASGFAPFSPVIIDVVTLSQWADLYSRFELLSTTFLLEAKVLRQVVARNGAASGNKHGSIKRSLNGATLATARGTVFMAPSLQKRGVDPDNRLKPEQDDRWRGTEGQTTSYHVVKESTSPARRRRVWRIS